VDGRFLVQKQIGRGGLSDIYEASDRETGRAVAIKMMKPRDWEHPLIEGLMRTESSALLRIDHPRVPKLVFRPPGERIS